MNMIVSKEQRQRYIDFQTLKGRQLHNKLSDMAEILTHSSFYGSPIYLQVWKGFD